VAIKKRLYPPNRVVGYDNVGVDEEQNLSSRVSGPVIARGGGSGVPSEAQEPGAEVNSSGADVIGRGIIDDDELRVGTGCSSQGKEALRELVRVVVHGNDHRHPYRHIPITNRSGGRRVGCPARGKDTRVCRDFAHVRADRFPGGLRGAEIRQQKH